MPPPPVLLGLGLSLRQSCVVRLRSRATEKYNFLVVTSIHKARTQGPIIFYPIKHR